MKWSFRIVRQSLMAHPEVRTMSDLIDLGRDDALAALLDEAGSDGTTIQVSPDVIAKRLKSRGVVVLPPDHPLRTGKESEPMFDAARTAFNAAIKNWHWDEAFRIALRAALAVIKEDK